MVTVAGLFDSQDQATAAMDVLLRTNIKDLETRVVESGSPGMTGEEQPGVGFAVIPNTSGGVSQSSVGGGGIGAPIGAGRDMRWLDDLDEVERAFYYEGFKEGATLAMARVHDEDVDKVRRVFRDNGARTYVED
jgi:hypothetical protein